MKLLWSAFALADRDGIFTHFEADNPRAAIVIDERIAAAVRLLVDFPESGRLGRLGRLGRVVGTRELVINDTPYIAAYIVTENAIRILRVLHGTQRWPDELPEG
ncbi:Addiction module toxin, RelE/StbE (plasmid) [Nitrobacter hamburgensis X14]|uniref:Addiction module toxin, RelE/StbE n=1 Tax=Nitrobacter hamburgensis (strain DSM 10229 / NCIMB 13809 / X14) TaxID=323097 RepID=Q1QEX6_NITHX|nr:type II toxin-antitoxin system RelE/ParE family toxin [Nitrobacter hamburgensis]ABE65221.1 Addiction module toxin, RelE/StbE [Nitrobacter hamburgensis X14]